MIIFLLVCCFSLLFVRNHFRVKRKYCGILLYGMVLLFLLITCLFFSLFSTLDPKTEEWPLIATPWPTVALVAMYLFIVKVGPKIMETRPAYSLREVLIVYNFALVLLSGWMVYEVSVPHGSVITLKMMPE